MQLSKDDVTVEMLPNRVFIYPTDTIYGIGCDATKSELIARLREIKQRDAKPLSVIAPSIDWIHDNCIITPHAEKYLRKLPGPYTLILQLKEPHLVPTELTGGAPTIGIRIPNHWISTLVQQYGKPIVTTSANLSGQKHMETLEDLPEQVRNAVDFIIYDGPIKGNPSTVVQLTNGEEVLRP